MGKKAIVRAERGRKVCDRVMSLVEEAELERRLGRDSESQVERNACGYVMARGRLW